MLRQDQTSQTFDPATDAVVTGTITDTEGQPIEGALASVAGIINAAADSSGGYRLLVKGLDPAAEGIALAFGAAGYADGYYDGTACSPIGNGDKLPLAPGATAEVNCTLLRQDQTQAVVSGTVTNSEGEHLRGAEVRLADKAGHGPGPVTTDPNRAYRVVMGSDSCQTLEGSRQCFGTEAMRKVIMMAPVAPRVV